MSKQQDLLKLRPKEQYIALLDDKDFDFGWEPEEVKTLISLWNKGKDIWSMADHFNRDVDELFILLIDLSRQKRIDKRERGVYG